MRRAAVSLAILLFAAAWAGSPVPGKAACASTSTLEQSAQLPGAAIFTGRATGAMPESGDVVFAVDRWFHGPHAARVVRLLAPYAYVVEPPTAGVIRATLAKVISGEAISLVRDQPVLMVATWVPESGEFGTQPCSIAGLPLDSAEGRAAIAEAVALFGPDMPAAGISSTDALDAGTPDPAAGSGTTNSWPTLILGVALMGGLVLARRRMAG